MLDRRLVPVRVLVSSFKAAVAALGLARWACCHICLLPPTFCCGRPFFFLSLLPRLLANGVRRAVLHRIGGSHHRSDTQKE